MLSLLGAVFEGFSGISDSDPDPEKSYSSSVKPGISTTFKTLGLPSSFNK